MVDNVDSRLYSFSPIETGHIHPEERCTYHFHDLPILSFCKTILLGCVGAISMMSYSVLSKIIAKRVHKKFHGIVRLSYLNLFLKLSCHHVVEFLKGSTIITFLMK
jgi:hypothetical protein